MPSIKGNVDAEDTKSTLNKRGFDSAGGGVDSLLSSSSQLRHSITAMSSSKMYDEMSKDERDAHDAKEREREKTEQAGELPSVR